LRNPFLLVDTTFSLSDTRLRSEATHYRLAGTDHKKKAPSSLM